MITKPITSRGFSVNGIHDVCDFIAWKSNAFRGRNEHSNPISRPNLEYGAIDALANGIQAYSFDPNDELLGTECI